MRLRCLTVRLQRLNRTIIPYEKMPAITFALTILDRSAASEMNKKSIGGVTEERTTTVLLHDLNGTKRSLMQLQAFLQARHRVECVTFAVSAAWLCEFFNNRSRPLSNAPPLGIIMKRKLLVIACLIFGITGIAAASAAFWYHHNFQAAPFKPVHLSPAEQQALKKKMGVTAAENDPAKTIVLSEREINGWLQEQGLGDQLKVSIGSGGITASALLPVDGDVPFIGGHTVRFKIALNARLDTKHHLALYVSDVAVGGISPPNAWLGGIKGQDLLADAELDPTAKAFVAGIKSVEFGSGEIRVLLND